MAKLRVPILLALLAALAPAPTFADDLEGSDKFLCTAVEATLCLADGDCAQGPPWNWNIPQFIEIDLKQKRLSTTRASGHHRPHTRQDRH